VGSGGLKGQPYLMLIADTLSFTGGMLTEFNKPVYNGAYQGTRVALAEGLRRQSCARGIHVQLWRLLTPACDKSN
jgi:hypothetical protein